MCILSSVLWNLIYVDQKAKQKCVFRVTGLKILGRVGTHISFSGKHNIMLCILRGISPFKIHKIIYISSKPDFFYVSPVNYVGSGFPKQGCFFILFYTYHVSILTGSLSAP